MQNILSTFCMQAAALLDQGYASSEDGASSTLVSRAAADSKQASNNLVRRASKALLKQVEETRRKYTVEVEGLKAEIKMLTKEANKDRRNAELASVTAAAAKKAALDATEELERVNAEVQRAKRALQQLNRCALHVIASSCKRWHTAGTFAAALAVKQAVHNRKLQVT
jgi:chromosome segregation ATPase